MTNLMKNGILEHLFSDFRFWLLIFMMLVMLINIEIWAKEIVLSFFEEQIC